MASGPPAAVGGRGPSRPRTPAGTPTGAAWLDRSRRPLAVGAHGTATYAGRRAGGQGEIGNVQWQQPGDSPGGPSVAGPVASRIAVGRDGFPAGFLRLITPEDGWAAAWTIGRDGQTLGYRLFVTHKRTLPFTCTGGPS